MKKAVLELGGKDPVLVDRGVDPDWAAEQVAAGAFANCGQICTSAERIYVHADLADVFTARLAEKAAALRFGDPLHSATQMGPLVDARQRDIVHRHVSDAVAQGARAVVGGEVPDGQGFFYPPTVLADVTDDMLIMREETFGPVAPIRVVGSFDEAIEAANRTEYGLAATVLTADQGNAQRAWRELKSGTVKINSAWGGAPGGSAEPHKASGRGYGYGPELLDEVTVTKVVHYEPAPPA
jgi:acyl-CoA reductase-like NAD-dependent aldehyde dehydrogenase